MRFYYKNENGYLCLKNKIAGYEEITEEEYNARPKRVYKSNTEINYYKKLLKDTDYKAIKYAEGLISEEEYAPIRTERQQYRDAINKLEGE